MKSEICMNCADKSCYGYDHRITECEDYLPMTNADRIRAMSDEELADYLRWHNDLYSRNGMDWLDWLKSPVEEEEG